MHTTINKAIRVGRATMLAITPNQSPISVNADAGKSNLNVDRLDGKQGPVNAESKDVRDHDDEVGASLSRLHEQPLGR